MASLPFGGNNTVLFVVQRQPVMPTCSKPILLHSIDNSKYEVVADPIGACAHNIALSPFHHEALSVVVTKCWNIETACTLAANTFSSETFDISKGSVRHVTLALTYRAL